MTVAADTASGPRARFVVARTISDWLSSALRHLLAERERWFLWLPVCFGAGIAGYFALPVEPHPWLGVAMLAMSVVAVAFSLRRGALLPGVLLALVTAAGFCTMQWRSHSVAAPVLLSEVGPLNLTGRVVLAETRPDGHRLTLQPTHGIGRDRIAPERVRIVVRGQTAPQAGSLVRVRAVLLPPSPPLMPGAFDFSRMAWFQRLGAVGYAVGPIDLLDSDQTTMAAGLERLRQSISERVRASAPGASGAVMAALLTGDRGAIPASALQDMRDAGLAHLLAISGLHVGLVAGCLFVLVRLGLAGIGSIALRYPVKKIAAIASLVGAFGYLLLTGMTVPTQRAFIMVCFAVLAALLDRTAISMRVLAWSAAIVLLMAPESLPSPSFQMSFAAVLALIAVYEVASPRLAEWRRHGNLGRRMLVYFLAVALTTVVAGLATAPFAAFHFHRLASFGLVANLFAVPLMAVAVMPFGLLGLLLMPMELEALALLPMSLAIDWILTVAHTVASWPGATHMVSSFPTWLLGALSLCGIWFCLWRGVWRLPGLFVAVALMTFVIVPWDDGTTEILIADDGGRIAVRTPDGAVALVPNRRRGRTGETWLASWGLDPEHPPPLSEALSCDSLGCVYLDTAGRTVTFAQGLASLVDDCRLADVVIATVPVRWLCRQPRLVVDRFALYRHGAHRLRLDSTDLIVETVAEQQGERPWSRSWQRRMYRGTLFALPQ